MRFYTLLLLSFILISCQNSGADKKEKLESSDVKEVESSLKQNTGTETNAKPANKEFISWNSVKINGRLPLVTKTKALFNLLGKPDSIVTPDMNDVCVSFYEKDFKYAYINNTQIEIYGDTAVVCSIDFRKDSQLKLQTPKYTFDNNTSLKSLEKFFPTAVKKADEVNVYEIGKTVAVSISTSKEHSDDPWLLFFLNGKLIRIDYYLPC